MAGHTKGPWASIIDDSGTGKNAGWPLCVAAVNEVDKTVVRTGGFWPYKWDSSTSQDEAIANAHLIAAAPELLEALKEACEFIASEYGDPESQAIEGEYISQDARPIWSKLCNAIAKARGSK